MPVHIKAMLSILTLIVGIVFWYFEGLYGQSHVAVVGLCLSVFMVAAMWIFPETGNKRR